MLSIFGDSIYCFEYYMHFIHIQELRRQYGKKMGLEPEHPRAGSCDDVEGIFALLHGMLGSIFDEKLSMMLFQK
jgi:hypothetical protein